MLRAARNEHASNSSIRQQVCLGLVALLSVTATRPVGGGGQQAEVCLYGVSVHMLNYWSPPYSSATIAHSRRQVICNLSAPTAGHPSQGRTPSPCVCWDNARGRHIGLFVANVLDTMIKFVGND